MQLQFGKFGNVAEPGFRNVTVVPTGTRICVGFIAPAAVPSAGLVPLGSARPASCCAREIHGVRGTSEPPSTSAADWPADRQRRSVGFSWLPEAVLNVPPSLKAQSMSLEVTELPYGMPVPAKNATYCSPLTE